MRVTLAILMAFAIIALATVWRALTAMCQDEIRARLGRLPTALIRLAARRLPKDTRDDIAAEWTAELDFVLTNTETLPLTRLIKGLHFAVGLLRVAPSVARELTGTRHRKLWTLTRPGGLIGLVCATGETILAVYDIRLHHFVAGSGSVGIALGVLVALLGIWMPNESRQLRVHAIGSTIAAAGSLMQGSGWLWISGSIALALAAVGAFVESWLLRIWPLETNSTERPQTAPQ